MACGAHCVLMISLTVCDTLFYDFENKTCILTEKGRKGEKARGFKAERESFLPLPALPLQAPFSPLSLLDCALLALDIEHAGDALDRVDDLVQVLDIEDLDSDLYAPALVVCDRCARIAYAGLHVRDRARNACDHARAILRNREQLDRIRLLIGLARPLDLDDALGIDHQLRDVLATR